MRAGPVRRAQPMPGRRIAGAPYCPVGSRAVPLAAAGYESDTRADRTAPRCPRIDRRIEAARHGLRGCRYVRHFGQVTVVRFAWFTCLSGRGEGVTVSGLPSGTVTFLFTDLEGSTRLWEEYPEAMQPALARHDEILRDAIARTTGTSSRRRATACMQCSRRHGTRWRPRSRHSTRLPWRSGTRTSP